MSSRFTALESDVLDALAWELRDVAPDLAGQFAESLPGSRRNTGSGLCTELIVDRSRPPPLTSPTGRFGTVHAMVGDLVDPVAFQVELRQGRMLFLHGDAYDQGTGDIDFTRVPFDQVFTIDARGESVAFDPAVQMQPSSLLDLHEHTDHQPPCPVERPLTNAGALQRVQNPGPQELMGVLFGSIVPAPDAYVSPPDETDQTSLLIGVWVAIAVGAVVVTLIFRLPWVFAIFIAIALGRFMQKPKVLTALSRATRRAGQYEYRPPQQ